MRLGLELNQPKECYLKVKNQDSSEDITTTKEDLLKYPYDEKDSNETSSSCIKEEDDDSSDFD